MARPKKETHLFFEQGADEIQIRSWDKDLNAAVLRLKAKHPDAVWIRENADDEPGFLWGAVRRENFSFHTVPPRSERAKAAHSENGKRHTDNLKNQKQCR